VICGGGRVEVAGAAIRTAPVAPQHFLYFLPLPQGQGSLRPGLEGIYTFSDLMNRNINPSTSILP
jgi:hypothetical protein